MDRNLYRSLLGRLSTKMAIGFIGIVAIFTFLGVLILFQVGGARTSTGEAVRRFEAVSYLQDFTTALGAQTQAHYEFIFENREDRLADFREAQQRRQAALVGMRERVETEDDLRMLDELEAAAAAFDANFLNNMQSAWRAGNRDAVFAGEFVSDSLLKNIDNISARLAGDLYNQNQEVRRDVDTAVSEAGTQLLLASLIGIALSLIIAIMATRRLIRPVEELKETCRAWSAGDIERRVSITSGDEIAELGEFFNHMADSFQQKIGQLTRLSDIALAISSELDWDYVIDIVMQKGTELTDSQAAAIVLYDEEERKFTDVYTRGLSDNFVTNMSFRSGGLAEEALEGTAPAVFSDDVGARHKLSKLCHEGGITAFMCLPLKVHQNKLGVFYVYSTEVAAYGQEEFSVLRILANQAATAIQNAWMFRLSQKEAVSDGLTGLYNQRYFYSRLKEEIDRSERNNKALSLIFADLDQFKSFNDMHGHALGDKALKEVAQIITESKRAIDVAARYGGEEFAIVLPETESSGAQIIAHRIRRRVAGLRFETKSEAGAHMTISIGVSSFPEDAGKSQDLVEKADWAMYYGKRQGGNRVTLFHEEASVYERVTLDDLVREDHHLSPVNAMTESIEKPGTYEQEHAESVARLAADIANEMKLDKNDIHRIRIAGLLHDIGLVSIPEDVINKRGSLNAEEWNIIRQHSESGESILEHVSSFKDFLPLVRHHHEHFDGAGYPDGLSKYSIPIGARVIAVADAYQAMVSERPYRRAFMLEEAVEKIKAGAGTQFDPNIVKVFLSLIGKQRTRTVR